MDTLRSNERIQSFDLLRGFFIILALHQHFAYYLSHWYIDYFKNRGELTGFYSIHINSISKYIPIDSVTELMAFVFTPWVSQIYIALAAFNLAKRTQIDFKKVYHIKLKLFSVIFLLFIFENFLVAVDMGEALSFYPVMGWMIILGAIASFYHYFGLRGVYLLTILTVLERFTPLDSYVDQLENYLSQNFHESFEYDARIFYYFTSACIGFILGHHFFHNKKFNMKFLGITSLLGSLLVLSYILAGEAYKIDVNDIFKTEHLLSFTILGNFAIWGSQILVINLGIFLHLKRIELNQLAFIKWIGINSLGIFFMHRFLFVHLIVPIREFVGTFIGLPVTNTTIEIYCAIFLVCLVQLFILKLRPHKLLWESS